MPMRNKNELITKIKQMTEQVLMFMILLIVLLVVAKQVTK